MIARSIAIGRCCAKPFQAIEFPIKLLRQASSTVLHHTVTILVVSETKVIGADWISKWATSFVTLKRISGVVADLLEFTAGEFVSQLSISVTEDLLLRSVVGDIWDIRCFENTLTNALFGDRDSYGPARFTYVDIDITFLWASKRESSYVTLSASRQLFHGNSRQNRQSR